jgi:hypothetical protein
MDAMLHCVIDADIEFNYCLDAPCSRSTQTAPNWSKRCSTSALTPVTPCPKADV